MDGINQSLGGRAPYSDQWARAGTNLAMQAAIPSATPPQPNIANLVGTAESALKRLHGLAESIDNLGDKLVGSPEPRTGEGSASGPGVGSLGQIASFLSMIHATISRIEKGAGRLHDIHG